MPSILAAPANLPGFVAAETRMVHDVATLKPSDYRAADGASWVIATLTPAADSGTNVTGTTYFDTAKGQTVPVPDARRRYANRGTWQVVAVRPSVPATGRYDWLTLAWLPINRRPLPQTPEHLYSPFIRGGTIVSMESRRGRRRAVRQRADDLSGMDAAGGRCVAGGSGSVTGRGQRVVCTATARSPESGHESDDRRARLQRRTA